MLVLSKPFELVALFSFGSDGSATRSWYVTLNVDNGNLISFLSVFKLFDVHL
jgi:hypothetical protein